MKDEYSPASGRNQRIDKVNEQAVVEENEVCILSSRFNGSRVMFSTEASKYSIHKKYEKCGVYHAENSRNSCAACVSHVSIDKIQGCSKQEYDPMNERLSVKMLLKNGFAMNFD